MTSYSLTLKGWDAATVCDDCKELAFTCPCAVADQVATGMSADTDGAA